MPKIPVQEQQLYFQEPGLTPLHDQLIALTGHRHAIMSHSLQLVAIGKLLRFLQGPLISYHIYCLKLVPSGSSPPILKDL